MQQIISREKRADERTSSENALVIGHTLAATSKDIWIIDSGPTCHICNDDTFFSEINTLNEPQEVSLGDGHKMQAFAEGEVLLHMLLPDGSMKRCTLKKVLLIPKLAYNLLSISKRQRKEKRSTFTSQDVRF